MGLAAEDAGSRCFDGVAGVGFEAGCRRIAGTAAVGCVAEDAGELCAAARLVSDHVAEQAGCRCCAGTDTVRLAAGDGSGLVSSALPVALPAALTAPSTAVFVLTHSE
jgi:hypothetical protein